MILIELSVFYIDAKGETAGKGSNFWIDERDNFDDTLKRYLQAYRDLCQEVAKVSATPANAEQSKLFRESVLNESAKMTVTKLKLC